MIETAGGCVLPISGPTQAGKAGARRLRRSARYTPSRHHRIVHTGTGLLRSHSRSAMSFA